MLKADSNLSSTKQLQQAGSVSSSVKEEQPPPPPMFFHGPAEEGNVGRSNA